MGQAEQPKNPQNPEDPNDPEEPIDESKFMPYIETLNKLLPDDYYTCPKNKFGSSNIPVYFPDKSDNQRKIYTPPDGYTLYGVRPGACMREFFEMSGFTESHQLIKILQSHLLFMFARMVALVLRRYTSWGMYT